MAGRQEQPLSRPGHLLHQGGGEVDAGNPALQGPFKDAGGPDNPDPVGYDQLGGGEDLGEKPAPAW